MVRYLGRCLTPYALLRRDFEVIWLVSVGQVICNLDDLELSILAMVIQYAQLCVRGRKR